MVQAVGDGVGIHEARQEPTGLPLPTLQWVGRRAAGLPPGFTPHPFISKLCASRRQAPPVMQYDLTSSAKSVHQQMHDCAAVCAFCTMCVAIGQHIYRIATVAHSATCSMGARHGFGGCLLRRQEGSKSPSRCTICRKMVEGAASRVDFAMAEVLAFGTLLLHRGLVAETSNAETSGAATDGAAPDPEGQLSPDDAAAAGLNLGHYGVALLLSIPSTVPAIVPLLCSHSDDHNC